MRKSIKATETEEIIRGPRIAAWLPEAEWEWDDHVHSNLWPCELPPMGEQALTRLTPPDTARRRSER